MRIFWIATLTHKEKHAWLLGTPPGGVLSHAENGLEVRVVFNLGRKSFHRVSTQGKLSQLGVHLHKEGVLFYGRD